MTLSQVAKHAGVSITTASKVFNNVPTVRSYIRERVMDAAAELNYRPNELARGLRNRFANLVTLGIQQLVTPFFGGLTEHLSQQLLEEGLGAIVCNNIDRVNEINHSSRACGTILVAPGRHHIEEVVQERALVTINGNPPQPDLAPNVAIDLVGAYSEIGLRLVAEGRRRVAFHCLTEIDWRVNSTTKFHHVRDAMQAAGGHVVAPQRGYFQSPGELIEWIRRGDTPFDTILCTNDEVASRLIAHLWAHGISPLADLRIVGCDGLDTPPGIWTVKIELEAMARAAVTLLRQQLDSEDAPDSIVISTTLVTPVKG